MRNPFNPETEEQLNFFAFLFICPCLLSLCALPVGNAIIFPILGVLLNVILIFTHEFELRCIGAWVLLLADIGALIKFQAWTGFIVIGIATAVYLITWFSLKFR